MKQNIKRIWLALCMAVCLFALSACSSAEADTAEEMDPVSGDDAAGRAPSSIWICLPQWETRIWIMLWLPVKRTRIQ